MEMKLGVLLLLASCYCIGEATWIEQNWVDILQKGIQSKPDVVERFLGKLVAREDAKKIADLLREPRTDLCDTCQVMMCFFPFPFLTQNT